MKRVAIHSVPRSGSSWLGQIFNSVPSVIFRYQPLFSYAFKNALDKDSTKNDIIEFFKSIAESEDEFLLQSHLIESGAYPKFEKQTYFSHIVYKEVRYHHLLPNLLANDDELIIIGLVRNPKAVISSWLNAPREFRADLGWNIEKEWLDAPQKNQGKPEEYFGFNKWLECQQLFDVLERKYPDRFKIIYYEDLLKDTIASIKEIFNFCNIEWASQTEQFINLSKSRNDDQVYSVYRQKSSDNHWKSQLPSFIDFEINKRLIENKITRYMTL